MPNTEPDLPVLSPSKMISPIWLIPIVAIAIALSLAFQAWQAKGPLVEIVFENAAGIEPGKTRILYKNVEVGQVQQVKLSEDLSRVIVSARLSPDMADHLFTDTRFWVVRPRISISGVSGLDTLVSGAYIEMDPGKTGEYRDRFTGLEEAAPVRSNDRGRTYTLVSDSLNSIDIGSPVYHRQVKVGEVISYRLSTELQRIEIQVFVDAPYHTLVRGNSHFWNVSGLGVELTADGFNARMESLAALLSGGIAFDSPDFGADSDLAATENQTFHLYPNADAVNDGLFLTTHYYRLRFHDSIRGLSAGAPVELLGIKVGEVVRVGFDRVDADQQNIEVIVALQPARFNFQDGLEKVAFDKQLQSMIQNGLRAQLKTGSLLTGQLYVDLVNEPEQPGELIVAAGYAEIPSSDTEYKQVTRQLSSIVAKLDQLPIKDIGAHLNQSLSSLQRSLEQLEQAQVSAKIGRTLEHLETSSMTMETFIRTASDAVVDLRATLQSLEQSVAPDSELHYKLVKMADQVAEAARSLEQLSNKLNRYPQSLLLGHEDPQ